MVHVHERQVVQADHVLVSVREQIGCEQLCAWIALQRSSSIACPETGFECRVIAHGYFSPSGSTTTGCRHVPESSTARIARSTSNACSASFRTAARVWCLPTRADTRGVP